MAWNVLATAAAAFSTRAPPQDGPSRRVSLFAVRGRLRADLDEMVEVTFTVNPRVRRIAAHDPDRLPPFEYYPRSSSARAWTFPRIWKNVSQSYSGDDRARSGREGVLSLQLPAEFVLIFDAVTHSTQFIDVKGEADPRAPEPRHGDQPGHAPNETLDLASGPPAACPGKPHQCSGDAQHASSGTTSTT